MGNRISAFGTKQSIDKSTFALVANGEDVDAIFERQETIQRNIARASLGDDQFAQVVRGGASDITGSVLTFQHSRFSYAQACVSGASDEWHLLKGVAQ